MTHKIFSEDGNLLSWLVMTCLKIAQTIPNKLYKVGLQSV